jgi:alpha-D-ribose 1-methylphosphonate 5-triphosphate synthase subunit PhnH
MVLTGPGIRGAQPFRAAPLPPDMSERIAANRSLFPRGVDLLLAAPKRIAALPRSVRLKRE